MTAPYRYALALTREQAEAVNAACELLARVGMGQLKGLCDYAPAGRGNVDAYVALAEALESVEPLATGMPHGASPGISSESVHVAARRAWEVYQSIREVFAASHERNCPCVWHYPFLSVTGGEPRPRCEVVE